MSRIDMRDHRDMMVPICREVGERAALAGEGLEGMYALTEDTWRVAWRRGYDKAKARMKAKARAANERLVVPEGGDVDT